MQDNHLTADGLAKPGEASAEAAERDHPERARSGPAPSARDDQMDFHQLLDAIRSARGHGRRFQLIDSGRLERSQLEWLLEAGADLFTSDEFRSDLTELEGLLSSARKGGVRLAFLKTGPLAEEKPEQGLAQHEVFPLGRAGALIFISDREGPRDMGQLERLAEECEAGATRMVYYHHADFGPEQLELVRHRIWFHLQEQSLPDEQRRNLFLDALRSRRTRTRFILYSAGVIEAGRLGEFQAAGAYLIFGGKPFDYRSPYRPLARLAARRQLPGTAYYLYPEFLL